MKFLFSAQRRDTDKKILSFRPEIEEAREKRDTDARRKI